MFRDDVIGRSQAFAEAGMVDHCVVDRVNGTSRDDFSGTVTDTYEVVYDGACRVQQAGGQEEQYEAGQDYVLLQRLEVQVPMSATGFRVGDRVTLTASRDADLVGRVAYIRDLAHKTDASARRFTVRERTD
jgi:hypothetical protein